MRIVFLHGAGHTGELWAELLTQFPEGVAPSLPGHPQGDALASVDEAAQWLLRSHLDGGPAAALVGNSMGAAVAMTAALLAPQSVAALVLVGAGAKLRVHPDFFVQMEQDFSAAARTLARLQLAPDAPEGRVTRIAAAMERCGRATALADFRACDAFDLRERLAGISRPTLILSGSEDRMTPPKYSTFLRDAIAGARLVTLEGAGHVPQLEQPERLARAISDFIATLGEGAGTGH